MTGRYNDYGRDLREITGLPYSQDIPPLRDFPQRCDPRRERSFRKVRDIELSREDLPMLELSIDPYTVRRIVVPPTRSQFTPPSRIPNARDPRGLSACERESRRRRRKFTWAPSLVENDLVPQEEETCAVLTIDVSEWETSAIKKCYVELVPHECNVQRAQAIVEAELVHLDDGLLMSEEEAERRIGPASTESGNERRVSLDDSDVQEIDSEGEVLSQNVSVEEVSTGFQTVEDRPMLEVGEGPVADAIEGDSQPRYRDDDEDEDRVIYVQDEEPPPLPPVPKPDGAVVECVDLGEDEVPVKKEPEPAPPPRADDLDIQCISLDDDDDDDNDDEVAVPAKQPEAPVPASPDTSISPKKEPQAAAAASKSNDANVVCIDIDDDDDNDMVLPKQEPQQGPSDRNSKGEVLGLVVLDDSEEEEEEEEELKVLETMRISREENAIDRSIGGESCSKVGASPPAVNKEDLAENPSKQLKNEKNTESGDRGRQAGQTSDRYTQRIGQQDLKIGDCDSDSVSVIGAIDSVISKIRAAKNSRDGSAAPASVEKNDAPALKAISVEKNDASAVATTSVEKDDVPAVATTSVEKNDAPALKATSVEKNDAPAVAAINVEKNGASALKATSVENSVATASVPETSDIADKAVRSCDGDNDAPTSQLQTTAEVHAQPTPCDNDHNADECLIAGSEISETQAENFEEPTRLANEADVRKRRRKRKRFDTATDTSYACLPNAENKRCKEYDADKRVVVNDENKNNNCMAVVERVQSPVFKSLSKKRHSSRTKKKKKPSENVLQLSRTSARTICKPSSSARQFCLFTNFSALHDYFKNYTATYNCINFFCKNYCKLSAFEFLRLNEVVQNNIAFWNRYNNWQQNESNLSIEDVSEERTVEQLAVTDSPSTCSNNQVAIVDEVIQLGEDKTVIKATAGSNITFNQQSFSVDKDVINCTQSSWIAQGNNEKDRDGNIKLQRRHSLPMATVPQQNLGAKRPRSDSDDNPIKLTLKRNANDNAWAVSAKCTLFPSSNNSATNTLDQTSPKEDEVAQKKSFMKSNVCTSVNKVLSRWSCIDKQVPELDIDDFVHRPLPQKIEFNKRNLSITLQSRVKKRSTSEDSAIVSDSDDSSHKRRKLTHSTKERELHMDLIFNYDDGLPFDGDVRESLEIRELSPDSCIELSRPTSANICNNNNNEDTCKNSENQESFHLEDLPKNSSTNTVISNEEHLNFDDNDVSCLMNDLQNNDSSSDNSSSFHLHMEDESENPSSPAESQGPNIQIDCNCNLQKDFSSNDKSCDGIPKTHQGDTNSINNSREQESLHKVGNIFEEEVHKENEKLESLNEESNIDRVQKVVTFENNCNIYRTDKTMCLHKDIRLDHPKESGLQPTEEKQSTCNASDEIFVKSSQLPALNFTESDTAINQKEQEQLALVDKDSNVDRSMHESLNSHEELTLAVTPLGNADGMTTNGSSVTSVQSGSRENVDQDETSSDVVNSQALINNERQNPVEFNNLLESESSLSIDNEHSVILNKIVDSDVSHCTINDKITSEQFPRNPNDQNSLDDAMDVTNSLNVEDPSVEGQHMLENEEYQENNEDAIDNQKASKTNQSSPLLNQDQVLPGTMDLEDGLEEGDFEFITSIQGASHREYDDDDYDVNSDCDEYESRTTVEYSCVQQSNESSVYRENTDISNSKETEIKVEPVSAISEDTNLHRLQDPPPNNTKNVDATTAITTVDEEDLIDDIVIEYEKIGDSNVSKHVKPDASKLSNHSNLVTSVISDMQVPDLNIHQDKNLDSQPNAQTIITPTVPQRLLQDEDTTIEQDAVQTQADIETTSIQDKSQVEIPVSNTDLVQSLSNNSSLTPAIETSMNNDSNLQVPNVSKSTNLIQVPKLTERPVDINNTRILQEFNLTKEIMAPEFIKTEYSTTFENNREEQILSSTLEKLIQNSEDECFTDTEKEIHLNTNVAVPSTSSNIVLEFRLPQNKNNYDLLKDLNVNLVNDVAPETPIESSVEHASSGIIKVKNLNDMLEKAPTVPGQQVSSNQTVSPNHLQPSVSENIQQNNNLGAQPLPNHPNLPANEFATNQYIPNAYVIQPPPYAFIVNQPMPAGSIQPLVNMCNILPVPPPIMNNIGQHMPFPNSGFVNQFQIQNNLHISAPAPPAAPAPTLVSAPAPVPASGPIPTQAPAPAPASAPVPAVALTQTQALAPEPIAAPAPAFAQNRSDRGIVLASSMFTGMFDSNATSSFCSKTVFSLPLPPLQNIILPPPFTILPSYNQSVISDKIRNYKWALLKKLVVTLRELENTNIDILKRQLQVLHSKQTLTTETWNFQEKLLIIAQCVTYLQKLSTEKNYSNVIEAIMGTIHTFLRDKNLLKKLFGIFLRLKDYGVFKTFAHQEQPLTEELGIMLGQPATGMSNGQKEILKYQIKIYQEMLKIHDVQSNRESNGAAQPSNQQKKQEAVQRTSPIVIQQNIVTTTVSSPVTNTTNSSLQQIVSSQSIQTVPTINSTGVIQEQCGKEKQCQSIQRDCGVFASRSKRDNSSKLCINCGTQSQIVCSRCQVATYCSQDCQKQHWKIEHFASCNFVNSAN